MHWLAAYGYWMPDITALIALIEAIVIIALVFALLHGQSAATSTAFELVRAKQTEVTQLRGTMSAQVRTPTIPTRIPCVPTQNC